MMDNKMFFLFPKLSQDELTMVMGITRDLNEEELKSFAIVYNSRRRDPDLMLLLSLVGFLGVAGIHRFFMNQIGMGILYLLTGGLCFIGTIIDAVNYRQLSLSYNTTVAYDAMRLMQLYRERDQKS